MYNQNNYAQPYYGPQTTQSNMIQMPQNASYQASDINAHNVQGYPVQHSNAKSPYKYPRQISCVQRSDNNLYVEVAMKKPKDEIVTGDMPGLEAFGKSRFDFFIFKYADKQSVKFSIPVKTAYLLYEKTKAIIADSASPTDKLDQVIYEKIKKLILPIMYALRIQIPDDEKSNGKSPAYTVRLAGGSKINGRTAAEILTEEPGMRNPLLKQRDYYMSHTNHPRYGKNNLNMAKAIEDAITLFDSGMLDSAIVSGKTIVLYQAVRTPNKEKLDRRGLTVCRTMKLTYHAGGETPYHMEIMNCYAPPCRDGKVGAELSKAVDKVTYSMSMTEEEWFYMIKEITAFADQFRNTMTKRRFEIIATDPYNY